MTNQKEEPMSEPIQLKDGSVTLDRRLDRIPQFDERSRGYGIVTLLEAAGATSPRSYTWGSGPVTDQGREGACVGHGWTGELTAKPKAVSVPNPTQYAQELYHVVQHRDPWGGCSLGMRCDIERTNEKYDGTSVLSGAQELKDRGFLSEYRWAFSLDELVLAIGRQGPAVLGIPWYDSMYEAPGGIVTVTGRQVGGHCILARGVNVKTRTVTLTNSWGVDWGRGGHARISFDDLSRLLREGGEACIPVVRQIKAA